MTLHGIEFEIVLMIGHSSVPWGRAEAAFCLALQEGGGGRGYKYFWFSRVKQWALEKDWVLLVMNWNWFWDLDNSWAH